MRLRDLGTDRDCRFQIELDAIRRGILASVMEILGVDPSTLSNDIVLEAARKLKTEFRKYST